MIEFFVVGKPLKTSSFPIMWWNIAPELIGGHLHFCELFFPSVTWILLFGSISIFGNLIRYCLFNILNIFLRVFWSSKSFSIVFLMRFYAVICNTKLGSTFFLNSMMMLLYFLLKIDNASLSFLFFHPFLAEIGCWNNSTLAARTTSLRVCFFI